MTNSNEELLAQLKAQAEVLQRMREALEAILNEEESWGSAQRSAQEALDALNEAEEARKDAVDAVAKL